MYVDRIYRNDVISNLKTFNIKIKETDLLISLRAEDYHPEIEDTVTQYTFLLRNELEEYIKSDPVFFTSLTPHLVRPEAPELAVSMAKYANMAGVGPMAAVAGGFAQMVGEYVGQFSREVIVENGGDIYLKSAQTRTVGIFAGKSPFSNRIGIKIPSYKTPLGICTSSGTVGPSLSFGQADAAIILAKSVFLSDAAATAAGNLVNTPEDFDATIKFIRKIKGISGIVLIKDDKMALWGSVEIVPIK
ncbi:UPF0280 family protein [Dehalobacterium formicoaceticum]|uniref:UPF0280 family protein n=1 Tax=Dehalobacterium formicoaceticum TaxID=51515 RepID=UPI000B7F2719|nr:UPF0280 family protein [Dehalobacterium formicoaceticum]